MKSPAAERELVGVSQDGARFKVVVRIGAPERGPYDSWLCAASVEGISQRSLEAHGADSLQALVLALKNVRGQLEYFVRGGGKLYLPGDEDGGSIPVSELFSDGA